MSPASRAARRAGTAASPIVGRRETGPGSTQPGPPFQDKTGDRRIESVGATPLMQTGTLVTVFAYMIVLQPLIGLFSLALFSLQIFFVPRPQHAVNG